MKQNRLEPILRFYKWERAAISYGRTQKIEAALESEWRREELDIVRRPTGGGIVRHGNDVCFTLIWKKEDSEIPWKIDDSYCAIHRWILDSIQKLGIQCQSYDTNEKIKTQGWCFQNPVRHDLISVDKKIVGGAQRRDQETALHQGSIQLSLDPSQMQIFRKSFESLFGVRLHVSAATD
ncbi:MAG: hypothetical protein HYY07_00370 [Elusimicrobia bacterium]|nr:hypothetical protein [Elusimicrobiota bacterium]